LDYDSNLYLFQISKFSSNGSIACCLLCHHDDDDDNMMAHSSMFWRNLWRTYLSFPYHIAHIKSSSRPMEDQAAEHHITTTTTVMRRSICGSCDSKQCSDDDDDATTGLATNMGRVLHT